MDLIALTELAKRVKWLTDTGVTKALNTVFFCFSQQVVTAHYYMFWLIKCHILTCFLSIKGLTTFSSSMVFNLGFK